MSMNSPLTTVLCFLLGWLIAGYLRRRLARRAVFPGYYFSGSTTATGGLVLGRRPGQGR